MTTEVGTGIESVIEPYRMAADGIPYGDIVEAQRELRHVDEWFGFWTAKAAMYEQKGEEAFAAGLPGAAGELWWLSCLCHHYAQHMAFDDPASREAGQREKVRLYHRAAPYLAPPAGALDVEVAGVTLRGFLRLPHGTDTPVPCALLIGGLESTKEEGYLFENSLLRSGVATYAFDGPGQGETWFERKLVPDFERYASAVVDRLAEHPLIDPERLGAVGRSLGGFYAVLAAACDPRLRCAVCWGGCYDFSDFDSWPARIQLGFAYVSGRSVEDVRSFLAETHTLDNAIDRLRAPTLVLHGARDSLFSMRQPERFRALADAPVTVVVEEEGNHCCHNIAQFVRPKAADWLVTHLQG